MSVHTSGRTSSLSLTEGGLVYRIEKRAGLIPDGSRRMLREACFVVGVTWVPLFVLAALQGNAVGHRVEIPFLHDFAVQARFLLSVPLFFLAETVLGAHWARAAAHFVSSGLVTEEDRGRFDAAVTEGLKLRDSTAAELVLLVVACASTAVTLVSTAVHVSTWYALRTGSGISLTWSGLWFVLFCVPLFQFLILRWLWRQCVWGRFLWRMSRLNLQLMPTHPDEAGGLGFVGETQRYFGVVLIAYSCAVSGVLANGVIYDKIPLPHFVSTIAVYTIAAIVIALAPLVVFLPILYETKRSGLHQYGTLGTEYTSSFHKKWIVGPRTPGELLLGTGDIQSLADLGNSFAFIDKMNVLPMGPRVPLQLIVACLIPLAPLLLTVMPFGELVKLFFKVAM